MEEVAENIYGVVIPLPMPSVTSMNCYIIKDNNRGLIVDPGMAHPLCLNSLERAMTEIELERRNTDFFITHHHLDHFGLVSQLIAGQSKIYISDTEAQFVERIASGAMVAELASFCEAVGLPKNDQPQVIEEFVREEYRNGHTSWPFSIIEDGDFMQKGDWRFRCLATPGHSPGHTCLYEGERGILISGDALSTVFQFTSLGSSPLQSHLNSLARLDHLAVSLALPGHGSVIRNLKDITDGFRASHESQNGRVLSALTGGRSRGIYDIATAVMSDTGDSADLEKVPAVLKFFFVRDCFARLLYLEASGHIRRVDRRGQIMYSSK